MNDKQVKPIVVQYSPRGDIDQTVTLCFCAFSCKQWLEGFKTAFFKAKAELEKEEELKKKWWASAPKERTPQDMHDWLMTTPVTKEFGGTCTEGLFTYDMHEFDASDFLTPEGEIVMPEVDELYEWWRDRLINGGD